MVKWCRMAGEQTAGFGMFEMTRMHCTGSGSGSAMSWSGVQRWLRSYSSGCSSVKSRSSHSRSALACCIGGILQGNAVSSYTLAPVNLEIILVNT
jgi:hypothetical protein